MALRLFICLFLRTLIRPSNEKFADPFARRWQKPIVERRHTHIFLNRRGVRLYNAMNFIYLFFVDFVWFVFCGFFGISIEITDARARNKREKTTPRRTFRLHSCWAVNDSPRLIWVMIHRKWCAFAHLDIFIRTTGRSKSIKKTLPNLRAIELTTRSSRSSKVFAL